MENITALIKERKSQINGLIENGEIPDRYDEVGVDNFLTEGNYAEFAEGSMAPFNLLVGDMEKLYASGAKPAIFVHVRMDQEHVIAKVIEMYHRMGGTSIYLDATEGQKRADPYPDGAKKQIWSGYSEWRGLLIEGGVNQKDIHPAGYAYNTPDEHNEMIKLAIELGWESVIIVGVGYQMPRIALGTLKIMEKNNHWLKAYFAVPELGDLDIPMKGAQGADEGPRRNQFWAEFMRIPEYQIKNDLASLDELGVYLSGGRDRIVDHSLNLALTA